MGDYFRKVVISFLTFGTLRGNGGLKHFTMPNVKKTNVNAIEKHLRQLRMIAQNGNHVTAMKELAGLEVEIDRLRQALAKEIKKQNSRVDFNEFIDNAHQVTTGLFFEMTVLYASNQGSEISNDEKFALQLMFDDLNSRK